MTGGVHLVRGEDPSLRDRLVESLVERLLDGEDRTLALEDHTIPSRRRASTDTEDGEESDAESVEQPVFRQVVTALESPPFMTSKRVVVVREIGGCTTEQVGVLLDWLARPIETTALVLVAGGGRASTKLLKAVTEAGGETHTPEAEARGGRGESGPVGKQLAISARHAGVEISRDAVTLIERHFGEDAGRVPELVDLLHSTYGEGARLDVDDVEVYLGEAGTAPRYELANRIDAGDVPGSLAVLHRMMHSTSGAQPKPLHPLQIMATLQWHYRDLARLDDPTIATKEQAAAALGSKSPWAAKHRLDASRALGSEGLRSALGLLAQADIDLRGASGVPEQTVMEVLVARLAGLARRG
jgi:DNA polymerase-3 subunit delta